MECAIKRPRIPKEYLGAFKEGHRPNAKEFIDDEFAWELLKKTLSGCLKSKEILEWLTKFNNEYYRGMFTGDDLINEHAEQKERWRDEYKRKNDVMLRRSGECASSDHELTEPTNNEDRLIFMIDIKRKKMQSQDH